MHRSVLQDWVMERPLMQQTVLFLSLRGPDGVTKYGSVKMLLRWLRRCIVLSAIDQTVLTNPYDINGGSFTGPSIEEPDGEDDWTDEMQLHVNGYMQTLDAIPHHFQLHFMHAVEIVGYHHPDILIRMFWNKVYERLVNDLHLHIETKDELDRRLADSREQWLERADPATVK